MKTILLIEDNQKIRENVGEILELAGYNVLSAENGKAGIGITKETIPDLIICDVMMPELDGYGVLHVLSKNPLTSGIPFIFLTAKSERDDVRKGMNLGADDYLTKPFDDIELLNAIEIRLKKHDTLKNEFTKSSEGLDNFLNHAKGLEELNKLLSNEKHYITIPKKHSAYTQGSYPNALYFIVKGKIKTSRANSLGNELITGLYADGDFFGYTDLLEETPYNESAVALEDTEITSIHKDDFFALIYHNRDVANKFIKMLSNNVLEKEERLLNLAYSSVRRRVAEALIFLQNTYQKEKGSNFSMAITRDDLSDLVGASKETVIRTLSDFKDEGLVQISGSTITLVKTEKLIHMKN
jgi:CRP-like cAMP-binding protein/CheY-like chemotaxis protein